MNIAHMFSSAATRFARRFRKKARAVTTVSEPPQPSRPDDRRALVIQRILSTIHNNSILLCGPQGSGKTSMLLDLKDRLTAREGAGTFHPVYVNLRGVPESMLFSTVAVAVSDQLGLAAGPAHCDRPTGYGHRDLAHDLRRIIRSLTARDGRRPRLVLLVDGIDELNHYAPRTTQRVRSLFMMSLDGSLVMVASAVHIDRHWVEEGSPWYNFFEEIDMRPLGGDSTPAPHPG